jgi:hypothetical protein
MATAADQVTGLVMTCWFSIYPVARHGLLFA